MVADPRAQPPQHHCILGTAKGYRPDRYSLPQYDFNVAGLPGFIDYVGGETLIFNEFPHRGNCDSKHLGYIHIETTLIWDASPGHIRSGDPAVLHRGRPQGVSLVCLSENSRSPGNVSGGIDAGHVRLHMLVDRNAPIGLNRAAVQELGIRPHSGSHNNQFDFQGGVAFGLYPQHTFFRSIYDLGMNTDVYLDAVLLNFLPQNRRCSVIENRGHDARQELEDRHV